MKHSSWFTLPPTKRSVARKLSGDKKFFLAGGFTTIEMLVVMSVMTMLSGILILYTRTSENQIILFKERAKIINTLVRARTLASQTFSSEETPKPCGYGVARIENQFFIYKDLPQEAGADCNDADPSKRGNGKFDGPSSGEVFESYAIDDRVRLASGGANTFSEVFFLPPDPITTINQDPTVEGAQIVLETLDGATQLGVKINSSGQISAIKP